MSRSAMNRIRCGIWIDFAEAIVVRFEASGEFATQRIESGVAGRRKTSGGMSGVSGPVGGASHRKVEHQRLNQLSRFYERVSSAVQDADEIAIIGPGLAKKRFEAKLQELNHEAKLVAVLSEDRRTDPQVVARLREILRVPRPDLG